MIDFLFTIDYEIFGNGTGTLEEHIHQPARKLLEIFRKWNAKMVIYVEPLELEKIEEYGTDPAIGQVRSQIKEAFAQGFEIGLHLHPQWFNAVHQNGRWLLDYSEYNVCKLPRERIARIFDRAINYLRSVLDQPDYNPVSFRAGNWLFQPTAVAAGVLEQNDIRIDSSVFKGGRQHAHGLDYRRAPARDYYWTFRDDVTKPAADGPLIEVPIYTRLVPTWKMATAKRIRTQKSARSQSNDSRRRFDRLRDLMRWSYPLKLDFCRMAPDELVNMMEQVIRDDHATPESYKPIVAIGHTKDLVDFETVDIFVSYLRSNNIGITDFGGALPRLSSSANLQSRVEAARC